MPMPKASAYGTYGRRRPLLRPDYWAHVMGGTVTHCARLPSAASRGTPSTASFYLLRSEPMPVVRHGSSAFSPCVGTVLDRRVEPVARRA